STALRCRTQTETGRWEGKGPLSSISLRREDGQSLRAGMGARMADFDWHGERSDLEGMALLDREPSDDGIDMKTVRAYRLNRVREQMTELSIDAVVLSDSVNIRYATGARNMQVFSMRNAPSRYLLLTQDDSILF